MVLNIFRISKLIGSYIFSCRAFDAISFNWDAMFTYISYSSRRMVVTIVSYILSCDKSMC